MRRWAFSISRPICAARASTSKSTTPHSARGKSCSACWTQGPPAAIGIYGNLMTRANVLDIAARARAAGWRVMLAGRSRPTTPTNIFDAGADLIVAGEGELALERLLRVADSIRRTGHLFPAIIFRGG